MGNNPILNTDVLGDEIFSFGDQGDEIKSNLASKYQGLNATYTDIGSGWGNIKLEANNNYVGPLSPAENMLIQISNDQTNNVNIFSNVTPNVKAAYSPGLEVRIAGFDIGSFGGVLEINNEGTIKKEAICYLNPFMLANLEAHQLLERGNAESHEIIEAYNVATLNITQREAHERTLIMVPRDLRDASIFSPGQSIFRYYRSDQTTEQAIEIGSFNSSTPYHHWSHPTLNLNGKTPISELILRRNEQQTR